MERIHLHDGCTPFGLRSAPKLFDILADILSWIAQKREVSYVIHYLGDFLTMGPPSFPICQQNRNTFIRWYSELGVPLAPNKVEGPSTTLTFLGIILDTQRMEIRLPQEKLTHIQVKLETWLKKRKAIKGKFFHW